MKKALRISSFFWLNLLLAVTASAQLGSQDFPIPVTSNQLVGTIKPRRVGDDRLTRIFYSLDADKGDLFINVEAENLNGDLDIFIASNLRPLAKITIYAADTKVETGRVVFLRKPETLLLRIEGRTPNDNPAKFRIKFAGSFIAKESAKKLLEDLSADLRQNEIKEISAEKQDSEKEKKLEESSPNKEENKETKEQIVEEKPMEEPQKSESAEEMAEKKPINEEIEKKIGEDVEKKELQKIQNIEEKSEQIESGENIETTEKKQEIEKEKITENQVNEEKEEKTKVAENIEKKESADKEVEEKQLVEDKIEKETENTENLDKKQLEELTKQEKETPKEVSSEQVAKTEEGKIEKTEEAKETAVFANMNLIVIFKDGSKLEKLMQEVSSFKIDEESLVIVTKDGKIEKRKAVDVLQVIIK
ncbi:MAG: hypothetical protein KatS3mg006_1504 [Pyrinomonadaceae bacterium]|jgi:hypothetical protein|nr:MAG: hypothetical protein KatS3mg006_1504 [Pyrinomonadaceae bacterium]